MGNKGPGLRAFDSYVDDHYTLDWDELNDHRGRLVDKANAAIAELLQDRAELLAKLGERDKMLVESLFREESLRDYFLNRGCVTCIEEWEDIARNRAAAPEPEEDTNEA